MDSGIHTQRIVLFDSELVLTRCRYLSTPKRITLMTLNTDIINKHRSVLYNVPYTML